MAVYYKYILASRECTNATTDEPPFPGYNTTLYGVTPGDPPTPDGPELGGVGVTPKVWDEGLQVVRNATPAEIAAFQAARDAVVTSEQRAEAQGLFSGPEAVAKAVKALALVVLDAVNAINAQVVGITTFTFDPANLSNGSGTSSAVVTVQDAVFGDVVDVAAPYTLSGLMATGYVVGANQVAVRLHNNTGGAVNLASGTWKVTVRRPVAIPQRTANQLKTLVLAQIGAGGASD